MFNPKLVIFDMDGLMFDTERLLKKHIMKVIHADGYTIPDEVYNRTIGTGGGNIIEEFTPYLGKDYPFKSSIEKVIENMKKDIFTNGIPIKKGLIELLNYLKKLNIPCAIASSSDRSLIDGYLYASGVREYFTHIISGDEVKNSKPNPEIFTTLIDSLDIEPKDALVIEDSNNGVEAAYKANIPVVCVPDLVKVSTNTQEKATLVTSSLNNIIQYFNATLKTNIA